MSNTNEQEGALCAIDFGKQGRQKPAGEAEKQFKSLFQKETNAEGAFVRQPVRFTTPFGVGDNTLPVEKGRYRLIVSKACPWAHRQLIVLRLLGLEDVISIGIVDPVRPPKPYSDWAFTLDEGGKDPVTGAAFLSDLYLATDPAYSDRFTVPAIVDLTTGKVVNNDYFNLSYYWETAFRPFHKKDAPDLFPEDLRDEIRALNDVIFTDINNGVYRAGFAASQTAYEAAYDTIFRRLDELEIRLENRKYLFGDRLTDSDIRLWVTLARFDIAYYNAFRVNRNRLVDFPNLWDYARSLYQSPGFGETTDFDAIKRHYHLCCVPSNEYKLVPKGPDLSIWDIPGKRRG
jgi:putative glutathione S-transferase